MMRSQIKWLIPIALSFVACGGNLQSADANTVFPFDAVYDTEVTLTPIPNSDVSETSITATSSNAPYGLTNVVGKNYSRLDMNGVGTFSANPEDLNLDPTVFPFLSEEFFGTDSDKLFGFSTIKALFDFENLTLSGEGTINITGGAGRFTGATGKFDVKQDSKLNPDPSAPIVVKTFLNGSFQVPHKIPEPSDTVGLVVGSLATSLFLNRRKSKPSSDNC